MIKKYLILAASVLFIFTLYFFNIGEEYNLRLNNIFYHLKLEDLKDYEDKVVIVAIDDKSLQSQLGRWQNWNRNYYAQVIENLTNAGASSIGIDIAFSEESRGIEIKDLKKDNINVEDYYPTSGNSTHPYDQLLGDVIHQNGNVVTVMEIKPNYSLLPIPSIGMSSFGIGLANITQDIDNLIRRVPGIIVDEDINYEHFSWQVIRNFINLPISEEEFYHPNKNFHGDYYQLSDYKIPLDENFNFQINYFHKAYGFPYISFIDAYNSNFVDHVNKEPVDINGKIILIWASADNLQDIRPTPLSEWILMPGVEIHANAIQSVLYWLFLQDISRISFLLILLFITLISLAINQIKNIYIEIALNWLLTSAYFMASLFLFKNGIVISFFYWFLLISINYVVLTIFRYVTSNKEKLYLKNAFGRYLSNDMIEIITQNPKSLKLGGEETELSIFFSDIAGFTTISEWLAPKQLLKMLNIYLTRMTDHIMNRKGTVDKYIGDAIMAFWGAPIPNKTSAKDACLSALANYFELDKINKQLTEEGFPTLKVRIGIATGNAVVGNVGSEQRFDYTCIGDKVNLAARLEWINKVYNTSLIICENTYQKAKNFIDVRFLDRIIVKGKSKPIKIYNMLSSKGYLKGKTKSMLVNYNHGIDLFYQREFEAALRYFEKCLIVIPNDGPSLLYKERCEQFIADAPPEDWDFVVKMKTK